MSDEPPQANSQPSWWQTLPGVLTGVAALLTAVGGLIAVLYQNDLLRPPQSSSSVDNGAVSQPADVRVNSESRSAPLPPPLSTTTTSDQIQAGHYGFRLLGTEVEPYPGSYPPKVLLRCQLRVTDLSGVSDYVDRQTIRLQVDSAELLPENSINTAIYEKQSQLIEAVFTLPADADQVALLVGRQSDGVAQIPIDIQPKTP